MRIFINVFELFNCVVGIHLRSGKAAMPQQFFYCIQICTIVGKMRGKRMSQHMRTALLNGCHQTQIMLY